MTPALILAALVVIGAQQSPFADPNAPPIIDIALRQIRVGSGGSSLARSGVRGGESSYVYTGLGPCIVGAAATDPARVNSSTWRANGRVTSVVSGMAYADIEWQRIDYRPTGVTASPRVKMTLALPLGERVAVDFLDTAGSACRADALVFEIGVAQDHGTRLSMSSEGRPLTAGTVTGGRGGGGAGRPLADGEGAFDAARQRQGEEAARAAPTITRPMPPREYAVDLWLLRDAPGSSTTSGLAQKLSRTIGGTGGRFEFPSAVSALVIPVDGERLVIAITRQVTPPDGTPPVSSGWLKAVDMPKASAVLSFEIPDYSLRLQIAKR